jgi:uncharacterized protein (TIGR03083 family)
MQHSNTIQTGRVGTAADVLAGLRADRAALLELCADLGRDAWQAPSGCAGWTTQDVVAHLGALFWLVVDPSALPDTSGVPTERAQDLCVAARRDWSSSRVLEDYEAVSAKALDALADLATLDLELPLGDLGTYPASLVPNAFAFDHYTHIRADLCRPRGPLPQVPPVDELRLVPTIDWIAAAAPQQNAAALAALDGAIEVEVSGVGARTFAIGGGDVAARVSCSGHDLVLWATQRATWAELDVVGSGLPSALALAQGLHVF